MPPSFLAYQNMLHISHKTNKLPQKLLRVNLRLLPQCIVGEFSTKPEHYMFKIAVFE